MPLDTSIFDKKRWYSALYFDERLPLVTDMNFYKSDLESEEFLSHWLNIAPFKNNDLFAQMLLTKNIDRKSFMDIASGKSKLNLDNANFDWLESLSESFIHYFGKTSSHIQDIDFGLTIICKCIVSRKIDKLLNIELVNLIRSQVFDLDHLITSFIPLLIGRLEKIVSKTIVLEMHVASEKCLLKSKSSEDRFAEYILFYNKADFCLELLLEYPLLARKVVEAVNTWGDMLSEFAERLNADYQYFSRAFFESRDLGKFSQLSTVTGDLHNSGRCVLILIFSCGRKVVYKPRPMNVDNNVLCFFKWFNSESGYNIKIPKCLIRNTYGWAEHIEYMELNKEEDVNEYFLQLGAILASLYVLQGSDFHYENIIACNSNPVLIDLECLFQPVYPYDFISQPVKKVKPTVKNVGLLPQIKWSEDGARSFNVGGIGFKDAQQSINKAKIFTGNNTDKMKLSYSDYEVSQNNNLLKFESQTINPTEKLSIFKEGFSDAYLFFLKKSSFLCSDEGPISLFRNCQVRYVFRPTTTYSTLLKDSYHPNKLRNALEYDCWFDLLWLGLKNYKQKTLILLKEQYHLRSNDVPLFNLNTSKKDISCNDHNSIENGLMTTTYENVINNINELSEDDLAMQQSIIDTAFEELKVSLNSKI